MPDPLSDGPAVHVTPISAAVHPRIAQADRSLEEHAARMRALAGEQAGHPVVDTDIHEPPPKIDVAPSPPRTIVRETVVDKAARVEVGELLAHIRRVMHTPRHRDNAIAAVKADAIYRGVVLCERVPAPKEGEVAHVPTVATVPSGGDAR